jgi:hypothetical protein
MTVSTGSFTAAVDTSSPNYAVVASGSTGQTMSILKLRSTNEDVNLNKIGLIMTNGSSSDVVTAYVYGPNGLLGSVVFPQGASAVATSTLNQPLKLTRDTDVLLTVKADFANIGVSSSGSAGKLVKVDLSSAEGVGLSSGSTLAIGAATGTNGVRTFKSYPTVALDSSLPSTGVADGRLMRFKITASLAGSVGLASTSISIATSTTNAGNDRVTAVKLMVYADSSYSQPVGGTYGAATGQFGSTQTPNLTNPTIYFLATTNPLEIPAGQTYYFQVESTIVSVEVGSSVTTTLKGDSSYPTYLGTTNGQVINGMSYYVATSTAAGLMANGNFLWAGNSTTTSALSADVDWSNGYGIVGLPSGGINQTRSQ